MTSIEDREAVYDVRAQEDPWTVMPDRRARLAEVYSAHHREVLRVATHICGPTLAVDVAQEVFLRLWRNPSAFDPTRASLRTYLTVLTRGVALDALRREYAYRERNRRHAWHDPDVGIENDSGAELERRERARRVIAALDHLDEGARSALVAAYYNGYTYRQVAALQGIPEGTAKARIRAALIKLRQLLTEVDDPAEVACR